MVTGVMWMGRMRRCAVVVAVTASALIIPAAALAGEQDFSFEGGPDLRGAGHALTAVSLG